jgi:hypothetical protein
MNGCGSGLRSPSIVAWPSFIASSRADWVRRGAIDLIGQQVAEDRSGLEAEVAADGVIDGRAQDIRGQQVGRELDALEFGVEALGQGLGQRGLAHARNILDQDRSPRQQRHDHHIDAVARRR